MFLPLALIVSEIPLKRLLAPWTLARICDRRKRRDGLILARILQELFEAQNPIQSATVSP